MALSLSEKKKNRFNTKNKSLANRFLTSKSDEDERLPESCSLHTPTVPVVGSAESQLNDVLLRTKKKKKGAKKKTKQIMHL